MEQNSRTTILETLQRLETDLPALPVLPAFETWFDDPVAQFRQVAEAIGAAVWEAESPEALLPLLTAGFPEGGRRVSNLDCFAGMAEPVVINALPQSYENVELALLKGTLGVAENGAIWLSGEEAGLRVLPFICQRLVLLIHKKDIVPLMADAYEAIGNAGYSYGVFIAGPSKTADIEQSLVLGAHGARSLAIILTAFPVT